MFAHYRRCCLNGHILIAKNQIFVEDAFHRPVKKLGGLLARPAIVRDNFGVGAIQHPFAEGVGKKI